jgi:hypothetical protein
VGGGFTSLEPERRDRWYWRSVFSTTGSTTSSGSRSATRTGTAKPERFSGADVNLSVFCVVAQHRDDHLRVQSSDARVFFKFG